MSDLTHLSITRTCIQHHMHMQVECINASVDGLVAFKGCTAVPDATFAFQDHTHFTQYRSAVLLGHVQSVNALPYPG